MDHAASSHDPGGLDDHLEQSPDPKGLNKDNDDEEAGDAVEGEHTEGGAGGGDLATPISKKGKKSKNNELSLGKRLAVIKELEAGRSYRAIGKKYGIAVGSVARIFKKRDEYKNRLAANEDSESFRVRRLKDEAAEIDRRVFVWFSASRSKNRTVSGPNVQEKAKLVAQNMKFADFKASNGWLEKFQKRHNVYFHASQAGEPAEMDPDALRHWRNHPLLDEFEPKNVFVADETALFFRAMPTKPNMDRMKFVTGEKLARERFTLLLTVSALGEKVKPYVVWKSAMPMSFRNVNPDWVFWRSDPNSQMNSIIFEEYLRWLNNEMKKQNRKILLFLTNAPCHPGVDLSNIKLAFVPIDKNSGALPTDMGIFREFRIRYRRQIMYHLLGTFGSNHDYAGEWIKTVNVCIALEMIRLAWSDIPTQIITHAFRASRLAVDNGTTDAGFVGDDAVLEEMESMNELFLKIPDLWVDEGQIATYEILGEDWENAILFNLNAGPAESGGETDEEREENEHHIDWQETEWTFKNMYDATDMINQWVNSMEETLTTSNMALKFRNFVTSLMTLHPVFVANEAEIPSVDMVTNLPACVPMNLSHAAIFRYNNSSLANALMSTQAFLRKNRPGPKPNRIMPSFVP